MADETRQDLTELTIDLLSAFVSNNNVRTEDLPGLISSTYAAITQLNAAAAPAEPAGQEYSPAVSQRKSLASRDFILSMIDGKPYRSLKRHLSAQGLSPEDYRSRYNLPASYPMVAPGYSEQRREVAKKLGLGRKPRVAASNEEASAPAATENETPAKAPRKPRAKKAANVEA